MTQAAPPGGFFFFTNRNNGVTAMMNGADAVRRARNGSAFGMNGRTMPEAAEPPGPEAGETGPADELYELEHEGQRYQIPAALKDSFLRHADYTRKTQDIARQRRTLEQARAALSAQLVAQQEHLRDIAALVGIDDQLQALSKTNWQQLRQKNPQAAQQLLQRALQLTQVRNAVATKVTEKLKARALLARQMEAKGAADAHRVLRRDIKGWDANMARRLRDYGVSLGFDPDELAAVSDPRIIKALHRAWNGEQQANRASAPPPSNDMRPLSQVGRRSSPAEIELSDRMPIEDWMKARNRQVRQKRKGY